jgi:WD40 repeat protein
MSLESLPSLQAGEDVLEEDVEEDDDDDDIHSDSKGYTVTDDNGGDSGRVDNKSFQGSPPPPPTPTPTPTKTPSSSTTTTTNTTSSKYFVPYRTIGMISSGNTFDLMTHQNSSQAIVACPIYNRFHLLQTNKLQPILVSQAVTVTTSGDNGGTNYTSATTTSSGQSIAATTSSQPQQQSKQTKCPERYIQHIISDPTLSITIVSHGSTPPAPAPAPAVISSSIRPKQSLLINTITLYHRTRSLQSIQLDECNAYTIVDLISLGRIKQDLSKSENNTTTRTRTRSSSSTSSTSYGKKSYKENATIFAVLLAKYRPTDTSTNFKNDEVIPTIGYDSDSDNETSDNNNNRNNHDTVQSSDSTTTSCMGQIVIFIATRTSMSIQRRILLQDTTTTKLSQFIPYCMMHPATYVNKILIGGSIYTSTNNNNITNNNEKSQFAACLINIRTGKVIHVYQCFGSTTNVVSSTVTSSNSTNHNNESNISSSLSMNQLKYITTMEQSPAVDTVAMGTNTGIVYLINLKYDQILFHLKHKPKKSNHHNNNNALQSHMLNKNQKNINHNLTNDDHVTITSISFRTDSTAIQYNISPMAVGRSDGRITIWDLTSSDNDDDNDMIRNNYHNQSNNNFGRTILCEMNHVHVGGIAKLQFFPQEPVLISTGISSNAILMHIFDHPDHTGRILRQRKGHITPPKFIRYLHPGAGAGNGILVNMSDGTDASSCQILSSGGNDRTLRVFSTVRSILDKEYSQGKGIEKRARQIGLDNTAELLLPPLIGMSMCEARTREWGDLVTIHEDHSFAYVWSTKRGAQSGPILRQEQWNVSSMKRPPPNTTHATSVTISACGSFALIGTKGGVIYRYNVQSGLARSSYPRSATTMDEEFDNNKKKKGKVVGDINRTIKAIEKTLKTNTRSSNLDQKVIDMELNAKNERIIKSKLQQASHIGYAVTGVAVDIVNKTLISVGMDSKLILWNLHTQAPHKKCPYLLPQPAMKLCYIRESDLAAIALQDHSVLLFDCTSLHVVRRFGAKIGTAVQHKHTDSITDLCFSCDGRSLYTSSMDSTIRVWDVPTNKCVDWLAFKTPPTSLTISPTGQYLATTHVGKVGISLWSDKSFYETVHIDGEDLLKPAYMDEPAVPDENTLGIKSADIKSMEEQEEDVNIVDAPIVSKEKGLITLSGLPVAHWKNLFHLELVKQRNKPREPPKKPPTAPFFLQWRGEQIQSPPQKPTVNGTEQSQDIEEEWAAAWSDDDENDTSSDIKSNELKRENEDTTEPVKTKRHKITHFRSHIALLLLDCSVQNVDDGAIRYQAVTDYIATLGPSAIDVALSSLCNGMHDLDEGLPLLLLTTEWLLEACQLRERFEAINSYLHRFLHLHALTIAGIKSGYSMKVKSNPDENINGISSEKGYERLLDSIVQLKLAQQSATDDLRVKMDHTLCLLRHFSRMI